VNCSINTAPSSPERKSSCSNLGEDFYFSEPTSPTHFLTLLLQSSDSESGNNLTGSVNPIVVEEYRNGYLTAKNCREIKTLNGVGDHVSSSTSFEFEFSSRHSEMAADQPFAEELFLNGQIRPLNERTKSQCIVSSRPPLSSGSNRRPVNASEDEFNVVHGASKGKDDTKISKGRSTSLRNFLWENSVKENRIHQGMKDAGKIKVEDSSGRGSKRWRLKDFLDKSGSHRKRGKDMLWRLPSLNIPPAKQAQKHSIKKSNIFHDQSRQGQKNNLALKPTACTKYDVDTKIILEDPGGGNGVRVSAYPSDELHCNKNRRRSFLPYTRGLLGCWMNGLTRNLHPFSSI